MSENEICGLIMGGLFAGFVLLALLIGFMSCLIGSLSEKKWLKKYPLVFDMIELRTELSDKNMRFWNTEIAPLKNKIKCQQSTREYLPFVQLIDYDNQLERLKLELYEKEQLYDVSSDVCEWMRECIENEIRKDKKFLKFMKTRGWCKDDY